MGFASIREFFAQVAMITPAQFEEWNKAWRVAAENGSQESLLAFICRERGVPEDVFLQQLAKALGWPFLELAKLDVPPEARQKVPTKVAFQYSVLPTRFEGGELQVVISNPFDAA
ncbi:MAG TPA: type II/IV secretion system protein, partial [Verrucomicrobiae bacterium]|nr:type II/IV secretion system protein [Verrucomicrobiae bacterium]